MEFPRLVYKSNVVYKCVNNIEEWEYAIGAGWFNSVPDALAPPKPVAPVLEIAAPPKDDAPPTRAEMEIKARELGIKFDGRTGDKKLLQSIDDAMKGK